MNTRITIKHIYEKLEELFKHKKTQGEKIMSAIDDLSTAVSNLTAKVTDVQNAIASLKSVPNNDVAIKSATDGVNAAISNLNTAIS